jgi:hypothetical protein
MDSKKEILKKKRAQKRKVGTTITFTPEELIELARYVAAGMVLLQVKPSVTTRIKSALSRLRLQSPPGL